MEQETSIGPKIDDSFEGDNEFSFDLLINDIVCNFNNANQIPCDLVSGCGEEDCASFEVSSNREKIDEVREPPNRGKIEKVEDDFSHALASFDGKIESLTFDLHGFSDSIFNEKISKVSDEKVLIDDPILFFIGSDL